MEWLPGLGQCHALNGKLQEMSVGVAVNLLDCVDVFVQQALLSTLMCQALCEMVECTKMNKTKSSFSRCSC